MHDTIKQDQQESQCIPMLQNSGRAYIKVVKQKSGRDTQQLSMFSWVFLKFFFREMI